MRKTKRLISLILVAALTLSVCLMGGILNASAAATVIDEGNLLLNGSFETTYNVWNESIGGNGWNGFIDRQGVKGQNILFVDGWRIVRYNEENNAPYVSHVTDSVDGNFALKFRTQAGGNSTVVYANTGIVLKDKITAGYYNLSAYVKGTNAKSSLSVKVTATENGEGEYTYTKNIPASEEYQKVTIENIYLTDCAANLAEYGWDKYMGSSICLNLKAESEETTLYIDDVKLEKPLTVVDPNVLKNSSFEEFSDDASANVLIGNGQTNPLATNWYGCEHWIDGKTDKRVTVNHSTDAHSGIYSLKFSMPASGEGFRIITNEIDGNVTELSGEYELSFWVKGNNPNLKLYERYYDTAQSKNVNVELKAFTVTNEWTKVTCTIPEIKYYSHNYSNSWPATDYKDTLGLYLYMKGTTDASEIYIDDICLEKVEETEEILKNTSFESCASDVTEHKPGNGQVNIVADSWYNADHWRDSNTQAVVTHDTDAKTGGRSLKVSMPINGAGFRIITPDINGDITALTGKYVFSFWVKGDGVKVTAQKYNTGTAKYADLQAITATNEWQKVSIVVDNIGYYIKDFDNGNAVNNKNVLGLCIYFTASKEKATYALVDDISLMPADTVADVATRITGIKQPAVGANKLELPILDTNNDTITVSIAASSDENVIALDGTITTPKVQTIVDVTLKISDGTNEVTLDPIGVLVHGELDTTTQAVIEKAIADLDTKAETFAADAAQIDEWLEYKSGYVSKASKNLFAQKKLVFEFDIVGNDSVLDKNDIIAVRDGLLGENAEEYTIRDLVKTFNKVVEYNSYN